MKYVLVALLIIGVGCLVYRGFSAVIQPTVNAVADVSEKVRK